MSKRIILFAGQAKERATLLLAAAEDLGLEPDVVETVSGGFRVSPEVIDKAGLSDAVEPEDDVHTVNEDDSPSDGEPAKKRGGRRARNTSGDTDD